MRRFIIYLLLCLISLSCAELRDDQNFSDELNNIQNSIRYGEVTTAYPAVGLLETLGALCTASLISPNLILTAAHCVASDRPEWVSFQAANGQSYDATAIMITPGYSEIGNPNVPDLALIRLANSVPHITPLPLAFNTPSIGTNLLGVGFGVNETNDLSGVKRQGTMQLDSIELGNTQYLANTNYRPSILYVNPGSSNQISCPGDSGGPLINDSGEIVGVASFVTLPDLSVPNYCTSALQSGYVSVADSLPLIQNLIASFSPPEIESAPGACQREDENFYTTGGGCQDAETRLIFSKRHPRLKHKSAIQRCKNLVEGGYSDWRLPTANELQSMALHGGKDYLANGSSTQLWSKSREGSYAITVQMSTGVKVAQKRNKKRRVYCVRH